MKLKYMLRGLGIGMVVTASIMGAYMRSETNSTLAYVDEYEETAENVEVSEVAFPIESTTYDTETETETETQTIPIIVRDEEVESQIESVIESAKAAESETVTGTEIETITESEGSSPGASSESSASEDDNDADANQQPTAEYIEITVAKGDDSGTISRRLYNSGIVDSATEYDAFLMQHGYDKKITTGVKTIYITDTWQEIAEKLTH
jgi:hypothetical protein